MRTYLSTLIMVVTMHCLATPPTLDMDYRSSSGSLYEHITNLLQATKEVIKAITPSALYSWIYPESAADTLTQLPSYSPQTSRVHVRQVTISVRQTGKSEKIQPTTT